MLFQSTASDGNGDRPPQVGSLAEELHEPSQQVADCYSEEVESYFPGSAHDQLVEDS